MANILNNFATAALAVSAGVGIASASGQTSADARPNASEGGSSSVVAGTVLSAQLNQSVDSKKAKPGDVVFARTTEAVKADGRVVIPKGAKLVGRVTQASARAKGDRDSVLAVEFDRAVMKDGRELPLHVSIQALASDESARAVTGDDLEPARNIEGGAASASAAGNRGAVGGVGNPVGGATSGAASTVPRTVEGESGAVNSTAGGRANSAARSEGALYSPEELTPTSRGVFGMDGLSLDAKTSSATEGSVIRSAGKNVHLDSGTRILFVTEVTASVAREK